MECTTLELFSPVTPRPCPDCAFPINTPRGTPNTPATFSMTTCRVLWKSLVSLGVGMNLTVSPRFSGTPCATPTRLGAPMPSWSASAIAAALKSPRRRALALRARLYIKSSCSLI